MELADRHTAITKIASMSAEQVLKVLIFMDGMEAGAKIRSEEHPQTTQVG